MTTRAFQLSQFVDGAIATDDAATTTPMTFRVNTAERMRIDTGGFLGVNTGAVASTLDQAGSIRHTVQGNSATTTVADGSGGVTLVNANTTTNNFSSISFAASTGANANYYSSGLIQVQHGARVNGQYHSGSMIFSTSAGSNTAPAERMRIDASGGLSQTSTGGGDFALFNSTAGSSEVSLRVDVSGAASGSSVKISNSNVNCQAAIRLSGTGPTDGTISLFTGQAAGASATTGTKTAIVNPTFMGVIAPGAGLGYATGSGGTVTQATSKSTAVTLNTTNGEIVLNASSLAANTTTIFTVNNSSVGAADTVIVHRKSSGTGGAYIVGCDAVNAGSFIVYVRNSTAGALAEAIKLSFAVIKAAIA